MKIIAVLAFLLPFVLAVAPGQAAPNTPVCSPNYNGYFAFTTVYASSKLKHRSDESGAITLTMTLKDGILMDSLGRTGYIASNYQFQFDLDNGQAGTIYNAGFSMCANNSIALESAVWWGCLSGAYRNIYSQTLGGQCEQMFMVAIPVANPSTSNLAGTTVAAAAASTSTYATSAARVPALTTSASTTVATTAAALSATTAAASGITTSLVVGSNTTISRPSLPPTMSPLSTGTPTGGSGGSTGVPPANSGAASLVGGCLLSLAIGSILFFTAAI